MKHTTRTEPVTGAIRHFVDGVQVSVIAPDDWDGYVRSVWSLDPDVVAVLPDRVANFPGDKSSGTPARLFSKEEINVFDPIQEADPAAREERPIQEAEVIAAPSESGTVIPLRPS